ncbi:MAG: hypothetical protein ACI9YO_001146 [Gammaproteobacteria bacterium]|jgi:hypothetical protein
MYKKAITLVIAIIISGCSAQTFNINGSNDGASSNQTTHHFFLWGIGQEREVDAAEVCGGVDKVVKVEAQLTFINGLLSTFTFGIYSPRNVTVYCK